MVLVNSLTVLQNIKYSVNIYDLAITFLATYVKETKTYIQTKTCAWLFIAAVHVTAKK